MKKVLSIVLALMMVFGAIACTAQTPAPAAQTTTAEPAKTEVTAEPAQQPTEEPAAQPTDEPAQEPEGPAYEALGLAIKNKSGKTIDAVFIYPVGSEDPGVNVVEPGWPTKKADGERYERNIYIVRPEGQEMTVCALFEDGETVKQDLKLAMYGEIKFEEEGIEYELEDDAEDQLAIATVVAMGKTADGVYPGYRVMPIELKNKTGKTIKELYFYEEGATPETYNNVVGIASDVEGNVVNSFANGRPYLFTYFVRPQADVYNVKVVFEDDTTLVYPLDNMNKEDADGHLPNEIKLSSADDPDGASAQYDGDPEKSADATVPELLSAAMLYAYAADDWYPTYGGVVEVDAMVLEEALAAAHTIPLLAGNSDGSEEETQPVEEAAAPAGEYTALGLKFKNKLGVGIKEAYIYPVGEDKGANVLSEVLPTEGEGPEDSEEVVLYIFRETAKLGTMMVTVVTTDDRTIEWKFPSELGDNYKITLKKNIEESTFELITKEKDLKKIADFIAELGGKTSDGFVPAA